LLQGPEGRGGQRQIADAGDEDGEQWMYLHWFHKVASCAMYRAHTKAINQIF
jgi:hypothetical protein